MVAARTMAEGLKGIGLMKGDLDTAVEQGAHALFFPHGLGHMMGLDVHDMEDLGEKWVGYQGQERSTLFGLKSLRLVRPIERGFVFTIEPGIYLIPDLIDGWKADGRFREFIDYDALDRSRTFGGIRFEDNYAVTDNGCRRLGKPRPKTTATWKPCGRRTRRRFDMWCVIPVARATRTTVDLDPVPPLESAGTRRPSAAAFRCGPSEARRGSTWP